MTCPCLRQEYVGVCAASGFPHVPSIAHMETYCFRKTYRYCSYYLNSQAPGTADCAAFAPGGEEHRVKCFRKRPAGKSKAAAARR